MNPSELFSIGLDVSPRNTAAYAISLDLKHSFRKHFDLGSITEDWTHTDANHYLMLSLMGFTLEIQPVISVIENYAYGGYGTIYAGERAAIAKLTMSKLIMRPCPVVTVSPSSAKKFATGYGGVWEKGKKEVIKAFITEMGFDYSNEHESDACLFAILGVFFYRNNKFLTDKQNEVISLMKENHQKIFGRVRHDFKTY